MTLGPLSDGLQVVKTGLEAGDLVVVRELVPKGRVVPGRGTVKADMKVRPELVVMPGQIEKTPQERTRLPQDSFSSCIRRLDA